MNEKEVEKDLQSGEKKHKDLLQIEGYKALNQYGCQMSQEHLSFDRIFMPLSLAPVYFVLVPRDEPISKFVEILILLGGIFFIWIWRLRNRRSEKRLYAIWDILRGIEYKLGFAAHRTLKECMDNPFDAQFRKPPMRDFKVKKWFGRIALGFYVLVFVYVLLCAKIVAKFGWSIKC